MTKSSSPAPAAGNADASGAKATNLPKFLGAAALALGAAGFVAWQVSRTFFGDGPGPTPEVQAAEAKAAELTAEAAKLPPPPPPPEPPIPDAPPTRAPQTARP
jgi:hypothetical protein